MKSQFVSARPDEPRHCSKHFQSSRLLFNQLNYILEILNIWDIFRNPFKGWKPGLMQQLQRAWKVDSWVVEHILHLESSNIFLFFKFSLVGKASEQARYRKVFILFGSRSFQKFFWVDPFELDALPLSSTSHSSGYPVLTCLDIQRGIAFIHCASNHKKFWLIKLQFHLPVSELIRWSIVASSNTATRGEIILVEPFMRNWIYDWNELIVLMEMICTFIYPTPSV